MPEISSPVFYTEGLAHLVRAGWDKEVRVKSRDAMLSKAAAAARRQLLDISANLSHQVRGLMQTFGLVVQGQGPDLRGQRRQAPR